MMHSLMAARPLLLQQNASYAGAEFNFTQEEALWAASMVRSRTFDLSFEGALGCEWV